MSKHGLRILLFIILCQCIFFKLEAQTKVNSCLYVGQKDRYVLTEKIRLDNGQYQTFNSLFIWKADEVIRIVFLYDRRLALLPSSDITQLKSFESFLPTFKKCTWHENPKRNSFYGIDIYDQTFTDEPEDETNGSDYQSKFKTVINARNKKYNPFADKFGTISVADSDPEVMIYNDKRKAKRINNLPLLFNSANGDSSYIISPIHIDVYRIDHSEKNGKSISKEFTGYKLYSSVSFLKESVKYPTEEFNEEAYKWPLENIITKNSLPYLYKTNSLVDTGLLINELSELLFSDKKSYFNIPVIAEQEIFSTGIQSKKDSIRRTAYLTRRKEDSIKKIEAVKLSFFKGVDFHYQYCSECYDTEIPKKERINKHCPLKIELYKNQPNENWSFAFYDTHSYYFKVEGPSINTTGIASNQEADFHKWFLMSPGIGYWMSDVAINNNQYSINSAYLFLNGKKLRDN